MMIGGGETSCERVENGVGSTEADDCSIVEKGDVATEFDFGWKLIQDLFHPRHIHLRCLHRVSRARAPMTRALVMYAS